MTQDRESISTLEIRAALRLRLETVAPVLGLDMDVPRSDGALLSALSVIVRNSPLPGHSWLLFIAVSGTFPTGRQLDEFRRLASLSSDSSAMLGILEGTLDAASRPGVGTRRLQIVEDAVLVDVAFCASHEHNTGIQRVVRKTMPRWAADRRPHCLVTWTHDSSAMRLLTPLEEDRVLRWDSRTQFATRDDRRPTLPRDEVVVVPWRSKVLIAEVPQPQLCLHHSALAEHSGNHVVAIGYDTIPLTSAEGQSNAESERFAHYLTVLKHTAKVLAISRSAADEFTGFTDMLSAQGMRGPEVVAVPLATEVPRVAPTRPPEESAVSDTELPLILCVGSHEPRKNQEAVLHAATMLHAIGWQFELVFVGGGSAPVLSRFDRKVSALRKKGLPISSHRRLADDALWELFSRARFSVFVSLHEGFGLPVAESIALGVPVLTSSYGSVAEIAARGGCLLVDPRDDEAITNGMRTLLGDDALIGRLRREASSIEPRLWQEYADDLWRAAGLDKELR